MLYPRKLPEVYVGRDLFAEGLMTVNEACAFVRLSRPTLYRRMDDGFLPFDKIGKKCRRIPRVALRIFAEEL